MQLSSESIKGFQEAYKIDFGISLNELEAQEMAQNLLSFYQLITPKNEKTCS